MPPLSNHPRLPRSVPDPKWQSIFEVATCSHIYHPEKPDQILSQSCSSSRNIPSVADIEAQTNLMFLTLLLFAKLKTTNVCGHNFCSRSTVQKWPLIVLSLLLLSLQVSTSQREPLRSNRTPRYCRRLPTVPRKGKERAASRLLKCKQAIPYF